MVDYLWLERAQAIENAEFNEPPLLRNDVSAGSEL
jgi:hypothetical protein